MVAVDVGYGQLAWSLRQDPRVRVHDRTNVRELTPELVGGPVDLVVGDLSFISLELVLDALLGVTAPDGDLALMVKPQFEVGKDRLGKGGVVREPACGWRPWRRSSRRPTDVAGARWPAREPAAGAVGQRGVLRLAAAGSPRSTRSGRGASGPLRGPVGVRMRR